jgi:hypothetical protein
VAEVCSPGDCDNHHRPHWVPLLGCRWNLALVSRPALARNERNQFGPRPTEWVAYSCFSGVASPGFVFLGFFLGAMALGLTSLVSNNFLSGDAQARRRAHFMVWGTVIGVAPICLAGAISFGGGFAKLMRALWQVSVLFLSFVWPLSFAYAVVRHRVPSGFLEHHRLGFSAQSFLVGFFTIEIDEILWRKRSELS